MNQKMNQWNAWIWIKWKAGTPTNAWEGWQGHPKITSAWSTQGSWDCCLWVTASNHEELESFVWKEIRSNTWVMDTKTEWAKQWW